MQVQKINNTPNFQGHGAKTLGDVMNRLYRETCMAEYALQNGDVIQLTSKMKNGVEVSAMAHFAGGRFIGLSFPQKFARYKEQFCNKLFETYNNAVTKGKGSKKPRW